MTQKSLGREIILAIVQACLMDILLLESAQGVSIGESTLIYGSHSDPEATLDSIGLVSLLVDIEQKLEDEHGLKVTIDNDRAMSQEHSPFRSVRSLTDYLFDLINEENTDAK